MIKRTNAESLQAVWVRDPGEVDYYSDVLHRRHYLESSACNRRTIVHVVRRGRQDVAILTWESETRHWFGKRDELIGWTRSQRAQRLKYCIENRRFLMLIKEENLASQVLALSTSRLEQDGEKQYGHGFLLAETFVDASRGYDGACYKASGWHAAGLTQGGRGVQERKKKHYFIKELKKDALEKMRAPELSASDISNPRQSVLFLEQLDMPGLRKRLELIPDYRQRKGQYPLTSILALILCAVLCGKTNAAEISRWIGELSLELLRSLGCRKAPSNITIWRVISKIDHNRLSEQLCDWLKVQANRIHVDQSLKILSLDGKALRSATKTSGTDLHVLTLIESISGVIRKQVMVGEKTNEIPHGQEILQDANLDANTIVIADAMHTQKATAKIILKKKHTTSSPLRATKVTLKKPSSKKLPKAVGHYQRILSTLLMDE